ncbi:MAG: GNAT family N-acetyltransferase [Nocardioidaceae bacterium]
MADRLHVNIVDNPEHHRVEARTDEGGLAGFAQYYVRDGAYVFFHTEVDSAYEGQGIGSQIAAGVVEFVRGRGFPIAPECPFIHAYMRKHPETLDLLAPSFKAAAE